MSQKQIHVLNLSTTASVLKNNKTETQKLLSLPTLILAIQYLYHIKVCVSTHCSKQTTQHRASMTIHWITVHLIALKQSAKI